MLKKTFQGGVHPPEKKELTVEKKIKKIPPPAVLAVPLCQHTGAPNEALTKPGDLVKMGECIGKTSAFISAPVHSPVSGKVKEIRNIVTPLYGKTAAVIIENDGRDETANFETRENPQLLPKEKLVEIIKEAGIVGLGGAAFPTHVKLSVSKGKEIRILIINGAECEPYLTCDHRLMVEKSEEIIKGIYLLAGILNVKKAILAIEENKLGCIFAAEKTMKKMKTQPAGISLTLEILKTKYPQGGEKQLIKAILKKEVPPGKLPLDVGVSVQNVGTCFAAYEACYLGKPLLERCITVTGPCVKEPGNYQVRIGTSIKDVVEFCGGLKEKCAKIIIGGPMMGVAQYTLEVPVIKGVTGVLLLSGKEAETCEESPCIRCGKCVDICPVALLPTEIMRMVKYSKWYNLPALHPSDCLECGACGYICPSKINLVQYMKLAKMKELERKK